VNPPDDLTIGQLRAVLANGLPEETIQEALARLDQADEDAAQHARTLAAYESYVSARTGRLRTAVAEAVDQVDEARRSSWPSAEDRAKTLHATGLEAQDNFLDNEPLLELQAWVEAGEPEHYQAVTPNERRRARIDRLLHQGGR
jgi:predicted Zn-dependent peptidase